MFYPRRRMLSWLYTFIIVTGGFVGTATTIVVKHNNVCSAEPHPPLYHGHIEPDDIMMFVEGNGKNTIFLERRGERPPDNMNVLVRQQILELETVLLNRSIHIIIARLPMFWHTKQELCIRWGAKMSARTN